MPQIREQIAMVHLPPSKTLKYLFHVRKTDVCQRFGIRRESGKRDARGFARDKVKRPFCREKKLFFDNARPALPENGYRVAKTDAGKTTSRGRGRPLKFSAARRVGTVVFRIKTLSEVHII